MGGMTSETPMLPVSGAPWKGVSYGCTTRAGGVSVGPWESLNLALHVGDDPQAVEENRRRLAAHLPSEPFWLDQVHGKGVVEVVAPFTARPVTGGVASPYGAYESAPPQADAAITTRPGVVLAVLTADCIPVVIADADGRALGVAHAGWRGLAAGVLEATLEALRARLPDAFVWRAWIGPCIGQARFEVGDEVRVAFTEQDPVTQQYFSAGGRAGKWQADIAALARHRLLTLGLYDVEVSGLCTYQQAGLFYSYRRSSVSGRMATLAWLHGPELP